MREKRDIYRERRVEKDRCRLGRGCRGGWSEKRRSERVRSVRMRVSVGEGERDFGGGLAHCL